MNQQQRSYAFNRVSDLTKNKVAEIKKKFTTPAVGLSFDEKVDLIRKHKVQLGTSPTRYAHLEDAFDFSKYEKKAFTDDKKADPLIKKITDAANEAKDEIMLGEGAEALAAITKFEKLINAIC